MPSLFAAVEMAPRDPILGLNEQFAADPNPAKVNLGVGVYFDENGKLPLLRCVPRRREAADRGAEAARLPADRRHRRLRQGRAGAGVRRRQRRRRARPAAIATVQALGGTGGLKVGADFLQAHEPGRQGADQRPELGEPPRAVRAAPASRSSTYPYYDAATRGVDFDGDAAPRSRRAAPATIVVLHACCHNPTGCDLTPAQWQQVVAAAGKARGLVPFLDMAYQGFGDGIAEDGAAVRPVPRRRASTSSSSTIFSKSFSLYGERVGALSVVCASADEAARVL